MALFVVAFESADATLDSSHTNESCGAAIELQNGIDNGSFVGVNPVHLSRVGFSPSMALSPSISSRSAWAWGRYNIDSVRQTYQCGATTH